MENIIERIRKLLVLAKDKGASEAEAATAMKMASDLMMKYNIDAGAVAEEREEVRVTRGNRTEPLAKWEGIIAQAVSHLYDCRTIHWGKVYCFVGRPFNVRACEETFPYVVEQVEALYKQGLLAFKGKMGRLSKDERGEFRATFKEACALRVWKTAREIKAAQKNQIPDHMALVVIDTMKEEIDQHFADTGVGKGRALTIRKSGFGTGAGMAAAANVKLQGRVNK